MHILLDDIIRELEKEFNSDLLSDIEFLDFNEENEAFEIYLKRQAD